MIIIPYHCVKSISTSVRTSAELDSLILCGLKSSTELSRGSFSRPSLLILVVCTFWSISGKFTSAGKDGWGLTIGGQYRRAFDALPPFSLFCAFLELCVVLSHNFLYCRTRHILSRRSVTFFSSSDCSLFRSLDYSTIAEVLGEFLSLSFGWSWCENSVTSLSRDLDQSGLHRRLSTAISTLIFVVSRRRCG